MVIPGYTASMKTAISLPDEIFDSAEALAHQMDVSRSELYATAVAEYVAKHRNEDITATLNLVYAAEEAVVPHPLRSAQARSVGESDW